MDSTTTATVHTRVFCSTSPKEELFSTLVKLAMPLNPFIMPALLTSLIAIRKTNTMGVRIKIAIKITLGAIQI